MFLFFAIPSFGASDGVDCSSKGDDRSVAACHDARGHALGSDRDYEAALREFNQAIAWLDEPIYRAHRAVIWSQRGEFDRAMADYDEALRLDPQNAGVYLARAGTWLVKKDINRATADLDKAVALDPKNAEGYKKIFDKTSQKVFASTASELLPRSETTRPPDSWVRRS
jgi:tetratricopeptide (TPR) repeat protein